MARGSEVLLILEDIVSFSALGRADASRNKCVIPGAMTSELRDSLWLAENLVCPLCWEFVSSHIAWMSAL